MKTLARTIIFPALWLLACGCDDQVTVQDSCGDGFVDPGEQCDGANLDGASCQSLGHYRLQGVLSCTAGCAYDLSDCGGRCGDEFVDTGDGEQCDGENFNGASCQSLGYGAGQIACTAECRRDLSGCSSVCGNSYREAGEDCDDGDTEEGDGCSASCQVEPGWTCDVSAEPSACAPACGDGLTVADEPCDGDDLGGESCESLGYYGGTLACAGDCTFELGGCEAAGFCGDGIIHPERGEECDGDTVPADACVQAGFLLGGPATCESNCLLRLDDCRQVYGVAAGWNHTCAWSNDGGVWCWGDNPYGQLGDGSTTNRSRPVQVGITGVREVRAGLDHTCALKHDGTLWCWGDNAFGQLGDGTTFGRLLPVQVSGLTDLNAFAVGARHTCAANQSGSVWCWGDNSAGQLGNPGTAPSPDPLQVLQVNQVSIMAAGTSHTCAYRNADHIWCWGANHSGQLGNSTFISGWEPVEVYTSLSFAQIVSGHDHVCGLEEADSDMACWGANGSGQLGDGTTTNQNSPVPVSLPANQVKMALGGMMSCATNDVYTVRCWGANDLGQLGDGTTTDRHLPVPVTGLPNVRDIAAGLAHACAVTTDHTRIFCWGYNEFGQLGDGTTTHSSTPVAVVLP